MFYCVRFFLLFFLLSTYGMAGPATDRIKDTGRQAVENLVNTTKSDAAVQAEFKRIFSVNFDVDAIGRFFIGDTAFQSMSPEQQTKYLNIVTTRLTKSYANRFKEYKGLKFEVQDAEKTENDPVFGSVTKVESTLAVPGKPSVKITWVLNTKNLIVDVLVHATDAKFSMGLTNRSQFQAAWNKSGGNIDTFFGSIATK